MGPLTTDRRARAGTGYSPQRRRVFPIMSVADNVLSGAFGLGCRRRREAYDWLCTAFPILAARAKRPAGPLSGGEQQIVAFARAMCAQPPLVLLDEPFLGLAPVWIGCTSEAIRAHGLVGRTLRARPRRAAHAQAVRGGAGQQDRAHRLDAGDQRRSLHPSTGPAQAGRRVTRSAGRARRRPRLSRACKQHSRWKGAVDP